MPETPYDKIAERWHAERRGDRVLRYVDLLLEGVAPGSTILDLGCGTGEPIAKHIIARGFRVTAIDESQKMLDIASRVVPEAELIRADMSDADLPQKFAAAVAWDSIFHVDRRRHQAIFRKLADAITPGGKLLLSVGGSDGGEEGFTSEMHGHTFFYSGYAPDETKRMLEAEGFEILLWEIDDPSSHGHIAALLQRSPIA